MSELDELADVLDALGHPLRLKIVTLIVEAAGLVKSCAALVDGEAKALRYYQLCDFDISISPRRFERGGMKPWKVEL
jgi:hypothetical protein